MTVRIQTQDFDIGVELERLRRANPKIGAIASFIGVVRDMNDGDAVTEMSLEHYPGMTEKGPRSDRCRSQITLGDYRRAGRASSGRTRSPPSRSC